VGELSEEMKLSDLLELVKGGASIKIDRPATSIAQFDELVEGFKQLIKDSTNRTAAELARSQSQLEVLATLQTLIKTNAGVNRSPPLDLAPLAEVLASIDKNSKPQPRSVYEFDIQRTDRGFIDKIIAIPKPVT